MGHLAAPADLLARALAHQRAGRPDLAEPIYRSVLAGDPDEAASLHRLGLLCLADGRTGEAEALLERAVAQAPGAVESRFALANARLRAGRRDAAEAGFRAVLAAAEHPGALVNLAGSLRDRAAWAEAVGLYLRAVAAAPTLALAHAGLAIALLGLGQGAAALVAAERAAGLEPGRAETWFALGTALSERRRPHDAEAALRRAVALDRRHARAWLNLGNALLDQDRTGAAETTIRHALALAPDSAEAWASLAFLLTGRDRIADAVSAAERAVALRPGLAMARFNLSHALLRGGHFRRGFELYESRHFATDATLRACIFGLPPPGTPAWEGEPLAGRRLLVRCEQGMGDTIQMARLLALLPGAGRIVLACDPRLHALLRGVAGVDATVPLLAPPPAHDLHVDLMSLPRLLALTEATIPPSGYLAADPDAVAAWGARIGRGGIGLVWAGNPLHSNDRRRSLPPAATRALAAATPGAISLQVGPRAAEAAELGLRDVSDGLGSFADTAALIANLDLVIAVDTSTAHLAGALGRPVWVLLPAAPDWRWLAGRGDTPWYPSMRLFRQRLAGDWGEVVGRVAEALQGPEAFLA